MVKIPWHQSSKLTYIFSETKILAQGSNETCTETRGFGKLTLSGSALIKPEVTFADMRQFPR